MIGFGSLVPAASDWNENHMGNGGWMWLWGSLMMFILVGLVVWLAVRGPQRHLPTATENARAILAERLARGDIDPEEYNERLRHL